uniref:Zinc finger, CCHC-type n=1 Tax=Tanacetum cinerariifolium TaxID=118510 RepID=A0A6L2NCY4_TANCI|nr:zinc finger, CCHC-type [Tanacetum cinerariifolium]
MTTSVGNNSVFKSFFEKQKLNGLNFINWYRQLRLVLSTEDKKNYLEHPIPEAPVAPPGQQVPLAAATAHAAWELKVMFSKQTEQELLQTVREFHACKQEEGQPVSSYVLKMKGYIPVGQNLAVSLILVSLSKDYDSFMQNYNMHGMEKTVNELHAMLKLHEDTLPKKDVNPALHSIRAGRVQKTRKINRTKLLRGVMVKERARWAMHQTMCHLLPNLRILYHLRKINLQRTPFATNVVKYGTGEGTVSCCGTHICITTQGLRGSKKLKPGALSLYVGDGHRAAVEAIGTYHLELLSRLVIILNNCYYAPSITRGVISVLRLFDDSFINRFDENNVISGSKNNPVYFMTVPRDGIFEIDMSCSNTNDSSMYAISNKRAKINLESSLLWHCRLGHISKKRIEKLQHDGLLNSIDIKSLGNPSENKVFVARNNEFFKNDLIDLKASGSVEDLELIQEKDINPSLDTRLDHEEDDQEIDKPLRDLGEPANYKAALLDLESRKWIDAMNVEMQSMKDNDNITSRFQQNPGEEHWTAVKNILKYLRNTKDMFLVYGGNMERELRVSCYTDAGYLTDADDLKSQTGYVFVLNGGVVNWKSTKQSISETSSTDAEYITAFDASKKAVWIQKFIFGLGIAPTIEEPIGMYCDNTKAITIAKDDRVTKGARHFHAKVHYLRETIKLGDVKIEKVDTDDNLADPFIKALAFPKHSELTRNIIILPASSFM